MTKDALVRGNEILKEIEESEEKLNNALALKLDLKSDNIKGYKITSVRWNTDSSKKEEVIIRRLLREDNITRIKDDDREFELSVISEMYESRINYYRDKLERLNKEFEAL